ncbi:ubiquitin-protein ligase [Iris pallida]|uniref:RING-type E3 ubiquitin transferase n=1 Tax=Iris pallida TaxID=29817 RepID=A0AAX6DT08_IRIPA|nr:ubiquitin-protein ligase [Iris pallida]
MTSQSIPPPPRRILSLPAIAPCESVSPSALLSSLLSLAADVSSSDSIPARCPTHRRAVREALRHVAILSTFFADIAGSDLPASAVLGLSELHVTLQRLGHLLRDCSRRGARLWILMNSGRVLSELRVLLRSVAVALDVLPLDSLALSSDVRDTVSLLSRQAWKADLKPDPADERAAEAVRSALAAFAGAVPPDGVELKALLRRLQVRSWSDCGDEIAFLEEQLLDYSTGDDGEAVLLGNLTGLLVYCRATMFKADGVEARKEPRLEEQRIGGLNPEAFRCPISLDIMAEPVTISTGQTYDRASIVRWLESGCLTCPVTGEKLRSAEFVPNSAVQRIINQYCHYNNISAAGSNSGSRKRDLAKTSSPQSPAAAGATRMAVAFLVGRLHAGSDGEKNRAAHEIRLLSKSSIFNRACFVEADCVPWLLHLLSTPDPSTQDNAVAALLNLSKHPSGRAAIFEVGGTGLVIDAVSEGLKAEAKQNAAAILFYLSSVEEYRKEIGEIPGAIPALVHLLRRGGYRGKKNAIVALFGLLLSPGNQLRAVAAGAARALVDLLGDEREDLVNDCVGVLAKMAERQEGADAILAASPDVLQSLVGVLQSSTSRSGREYCVSVMLSLCDSCGAKVVGLLEKMPLLMPALYSVVAGGPPHASKKARSLVNYIHRFHDQEDFPSAAALPPPPPAAQDRVVHAR